MNMNKPSRLTRGFLQLVALLVLGSAQASDPVFLALLESDAELETAFPGEVIERLWRQAEMRTRRCNAGASDPVWLARVEAIAADPELTRATEDSGRDYLHRDALDSLATAGLDEVMLAGFRDRAERIVDDEVDFGSCQGFISVLQQIYDQQAPGEATPAVVGTVCGQIQQLNDCHGESAGQAPGAIDDG